MFQGYTESVEKIEARKQRIMNGTYGARGTAPAGNTTTLTIDNLLAEMKQIVDGEYPAALLTARLDAVIKVTE